MEELSAAFEGCFRFMPVSELDEIPRYAGQYFWISLLHDDIILNANSTYPRHVNSRLNRDHESRFEPSFLASCQPGILMYFQAEPVPRTMREKPV